MKIGIDAITLMLCKIHLSIALAKAVEILTLKTAKKDLD
jgi:hypothetical protein